jgi:hypothetical protein
MMKKISKKCILKQVEYVDVSAKPTEETCPHCNSKLSKTFTKHKAYLLFEDDAMNVAALYLSADDFEDYECDVIAICKFNHELDAYINVSTDNYVNCITDDSMIFANLVRKAIGQEKYFGGIK